MNKYLPRPEKFALKSDGAGWRWLVLLVSAGLLGLFFFRVGAAALASRPALTRAGMADPYRDLVFADPFGSYTPHAVYAPRLTRDPSGKLIESTYYGVRNPDMGGGTCFGIDWSQIYHAGEDLYAGPAGSSKSTQNAEVRAISNGVVKFAPTVFNYPGFVVIIEHTLNNGQKVYSVYAHLKGPLNVQAGQQVERGQVLGKVMYYPYGGNYPQYHTSGDDSHLHFEIRQFYSGGTIYPAPYFSCNNAANIPGVGYTYPIEPDLFPSPSQHYLNPWIFIFTHQIHYFIPFNSSTP
jgi:hypothetical protein